MIHSCRSKIISHNVKIISSWLDGLINNNHKKQYIITFPKENTRGMIYVVTSPLFNAVKIGLWSGVYNRLYSRYSAIYGRTVIISTVNVNNVRESEKQIHKHFKKYNIQGELFIKEHYQEYIDYLQELKK
jgi:hypothetical protein